MKDKQELDNMRQQIQDSLCKSKRDELRDKFGMQAEYTNPKLSPEEENSWLDSVPLSRGKLVVRQRSAIKSKKSDNIYQLLTNSQSSQ